MTNTPDAEIGGLVERARLAHDWFEERGQRYHAATVETLLRTQADNAKRIADLEAVANGLISVLENGMPLSRQEYQYVAKARAALKGSSNHGK